MKLKKTAVQPAQPTTNEVVKGALTALTKDVALLDTRRQSALSVFRQTAGCVARQGQSGLPQSPEYV